MPIRNASLQAGPASRGLYSSLALALSLVACARAPLDIAAPVTEIVGRVADATNGVPLGGGTVTTDPASSTVSVAADGSFRISSVTAGRYEVRAQRDGYRAATAIVAVREGERAVAELRLQELGPELAVSTGSVTLDMSAPVAAVTLRNATNVGSIAWRVTSDAPWLTAQPIGGVLSTQPVVLTIGADRAAAPVGVSVANLTITTPLGTRVVTVQLLREDPMAPRLALGTTRLTLDASTAEGTVAVANAGAGTLTWRAETSVPWLTFTPREGTGSALVRVMVDRGALAAGTYTGVVTVVSNGGTATVDIGVTVVASPVPFLPDGWTTVATFPGLRATSFAVVSDADVWIGGAVQTDGGGVVQHWDGLRWTDESLAFGSATNVQEVTDVAFRSGGAGAVAGTNVGSRLVVMRRSAGRLVTDILTDIVNAQYAASPRLAALSDGTLWVAAYPGLLHRFDGTRWQPTLLGIQQILALRFTEPSDGWAVTRSQLLHFNGVGWTPVTVPTSSALSDVAVLPNGVVVLATSTGTHRLSGGRWTEWRDAQGRAVPAARVVLVTSNSGWLVDGSVVRRVIDGVVSAPQSLPDAGAPIAIAIGPTGTGWLLAVSGSRANGYTTTVLRTR